VQAETSQCGRRQGRRRKLLIRLAGLVPYPVGVWILGQMSRSWLLQQTLFRRSVRRLEPILALAAQPIDHSHAARRHCMAKGYKWLYRWRLSMAGRADWPSLHQWFPVMGLDSVERAHASGRGVILVNSHFGGGRFVPLVLARMGMELLSLERVNTFEKLGVKLPDGLQVIRLRHSFLARVVLEAQKALKQGRILHLAADGFAGHSGFVLTFHGRRRRFAAAFAELAVNTGAFVLPVFAPFDEEGRVNIEFLEPLDSGTESMAHGERVESLVRQYVRLLERRWSQDPGNVIQGHVEQFLRLPMDQALGSAVITEEATHAF
jgi:lauroyl/myristoyl acyltransferase